MSNNMYVNNLSKKRTHGSCHLCGKEDCGKRTGRVVCKNCLKVFCLGQLKKKFNIIAEQNDVNFICPKCRGICCCVTTCALKHTHCKTFMVRENKRKKKEQAAFENGQNKIKRVNSLLDGFAPQQTFSPLPDEVPLPSIYYLF